MMNTPVKLSLMGLKSCWLAVLLMPALASLAADPASRGTKIINNAALMPQYQPEARVKMEGMSPDWVKTLIMAQFRIETATPEGTFAAATKVLDHYAEMGVNGLWINPVYERNPTGKASGFNGYGNYGPNTLDPSLTGTTDRNESFAAVQSFVAQAHQRNIRVIFDIIVWGVAKNSPLVGQHEEFFRFNGVKKEQWAGWAFNWQVPGMREWFVNAAVDFIQETGADGFRVDLAPDITGYAVFNEVRQRLYAQGKKVIIVSELPAERQGVYDFEQIGVGREKDPNYEDPNWLRTFARESGGYYLRNSMADSIKTGKGVGIVSLQQSHKGGKFRFYTYNLSNHDSQNTVLHGSRLMMGYAAIFAPYIPMWFIGEEWNNPKVQTGSDPAMYFNVIDWAALDRPANRAFYEDVKKFIRIRRSYPELFQYFPDNHRKANLVKVEAEGTALEAYARFGNGKAIIVVPNKSAAQTTCRVHVPFGALGMAGAKGYKISDLLNGKVVADQAAASLTVFEATMPPDSVGVYLVEPCPATVIPL